MPSWARINGNLCHEINHYFFTCFYFFYVLCLTMIRIEKGKLYQVKVFSRETKKCIRVIGEEGLTPKKLDKVEDGLIKSFDWKHFWVETVKFEK